MPDDIFISYLFGAFVIIGCVLFNRRYHKHYAGKVKEVIKILEGKAVSYTHLLLYNQFPLKAAPPG